ncbi:MAG: NAD(P)H-dependent oxidoreductase [bacterium]
MKVFAINSSARTGDVSKTEIVLNWLVQGMQEEKADVEVVNIHRKKINYCKGCFNCWTKTPGKCVFKDDMTRELLPRFLECDLFIMATPLFHYTVNAKMKTFIERTLPMALPFFKLRNGVTTHPLRHEPPPVVVLSVAGFPEMSVFDQLSSYVNFLYKDRLVAEIYRTAAEILAGQMTSQKIQSIREATIQGGRELVKTKKISPETMAGITRELTTFEKMAPLGNLAWQTCIDEGVNMGQFQKRGMVPRPDSIDTFMDIMRFGFNPQKAGSDAYTIQFRFSGKVEGDCHFSVQDGAIEFKAGAAKNPGLIIHTPFDVWMDILTRKADGQKMFMDQKYTIEGDLNLLLKMVAAFSR